MNGMTRSYRLRSPRASLLKLWPLAIPLAQGIPARSVSSTTAIKYANRLKRSTGIKSAPSRRKEVKVFDCSQDRFRGPHKAAVNARPERYSQALKSGDWKQCQCAG